MKYLSIEEVENGFVVRENKETHQIGKIHVFESARNLAAFMEEWARDAEGNRRQRNTPPAAPPVKSQ